MHKTRRRHSNERRIHNANPAAITQRALTLAARGDLREAADTALLAERLLRLEPKLRMAKISAETQRRRAEAAIAEATANVNAMRSPPPALPPTKPKHVVLNETRPDVVFARLREKGLIP